MCCELPSDRYTESCGAPTSQWFLDAFIIEKAALLAQGAWLAYQVRNVQFEGLNDSKHIGALLPLRCVLNVCVE